MGYKTAFQSVYTLLSTDTALKAKASVYDFVPEDATSPYIQIQFSQALRGRVLNESEREMYFDLHIWSSYHGSKEVLEIIDLIAAIVPTEWFEEDAQTILRDESGWYHGIITLKLYDR
jgi:hypothetical protein